MLPRYLVKLACSVSYFVPQDTLRQCSKNYIDYVYVHSIFWLKQQNEKQV